MGGHGNYYTMVGDHNTEKVGNHCIKGDMCQKKIDIF